MRLRRVRVSLGWWEDATGVERRAVEGWVRWLFGASVFAVRKDWARSEIVFEAG
jgi:hypothetical protein